MESVVCLCTNRLFNFASPLKLHVRTAKKFSKAQVRGQFGIPPYEGKSIEQTLKELDHKDPNIHYKVDIGFLWHPSKKTITQEERSAFFKNIKKNLELEKKARKNELFVNLGEVQQEWLEESGPAHIRVAAEHYGVFQDLFGDAYFHPQVKLDVCFKIDEGFLPVCRGNLVKPHQALTTPHVNYQSEPDSLWTLVATNPDGNLRQDDAEYLHWFVGNIPGSDVSQGEVVADYVQPFPARGLGFQRFVFILYKQTEKIDYSALKIPSNEVVFGKRTFSTYDFYQPRQDQLTPAGLAFCQVDWDHSVSNFFHTEMNMDEPVFEYDFPAPYYKPQTMYPKKQPFNLYMDRYRDQKQIAKEFLLRKLQKSHPFEPPKSPPKYPNAPRVYHDLDENLYGRVPSWLKREKLKSRLGRGRISDY